MNAALLAVLLEDEAAWSPAPGAADLAPFRRDLARQFRALAFAQARKR